MKYDHEQDSFTNKIRKELKHQLIMDVKEMEFFIFILHSNAELLNSSDFKHWGAILRKWDTESGTYVIENTIKTHRVLIHWVRRTMECSKSILQSRREVV